VLEELESFTRQLEKNAPCIVFIDEIDSVGGARGQNRGTSEDDKTLTALLNELDGFSGKEAVITIAATNRLQDLDPALTRPGRFDRQLAVPLPDRNERMSILELYVKSKKYLKV
jgi:membrane protease FtsH catalytic subunit (EC 3.4.24.-)